jgi:hypothetical protein
VLITKLIEVNVNSAETMALLSTVLAAFFASSPIRMEGCDHVQNGSALDSILKQVKIGTLKPPSLLLIVESLDRLSRQHPWTAREQLAGLINRAVIVATTRGHAIYLLIAAWTS